MSGNCVCGHAAHDHFSSDGMCFEFKCGCSYYDDGYSSGPLGVKHEPYKGIYGGQYSLGSDQEDSA